MDIWVVLLLAIIKYVLRDKLYYPCTYTLMHLCELFFVYVI